MMRPRLAVFAAQDRRFLLHTTRPRTRAEYTAKRRLCYRQRARVRGRNTDECQHAAHNAGAIARSFEGKSFQVAKMAVELDTLFHLFEPRDEGKHFRQMTLQIFLALTLIEQLQ